MCSILILDTIFDLDNFTYGMAVDILIEPYESTTFGYDYLSFFPLQCQGIYFTFSCFCGISEELLLLHETLMLVWGF